MKTKLTIHKVAQINRVIAGSANVPPHVPARTLRAFLREEALIGSPVSGNVAAWRYLVENKAHQA